MWTAVKSLFGNTDLVGKGMTGIGKIFFTEEERADYKLMFLKAYEPFKIAQRLLALMYSFVFLTFLSIAFFMYIYGVCIEDIERSKFLVLQAKELITMIFATLGTPVSLILGFYFGGGMLEGLIKAKVGK